MSVISDEFCFRLDLRVTQKSKNGQLSKTFGYNLTTQGNQVVEWLIWKIGLRRAPNNVTLYS